MINYIIGKIVSTYKKTIVVENNYIGYLVYVSKPNEFEVGKIIKLLIMKNITINNKNKLTEEMYGFRNIEEKDFFYKLLNITSIGYKTALGICKNDIELLKQLIINKDEESLSSLENITPKIAHYLVSEYEIENEKEVSTTNRELINDLIKSLKILGYTDAEINYAINNIKIDFNSELSDNISNAIKIISHNNSNGVKTE